MWNSDDDPELHIYDSLPTEIIRHIGPNYGFYKDCAELVKLFPNYSYYLTTEDDCIFLDKGWDLNLLAAAKRIFKNNIGVLYLTDTSGECRCEFLSREWIDALESLWPFNITAYATEYIAHLADTLGVGAWVGDAKVEHHQTFRNGVMWNGNDPDVIEARRVGILGFDEWKQTGALICLDKLREAINGSVISNNNSQ
jgi:hypothetical protein